MRGRTALLLTASVLLCGCLRPPAPSVTSAASDPPAEINFTEEAKTAGLEYRWEIPGPRPLNILNGIGNGCAFLDYDRDGNLDILLVGPKSALFRGDGRGGFTRSAAFLPLSGHFLGCAVGDVNNDSYPDIYLTGFGEGRLLLNRGGVRFEEVSAAWGIEKQYWGTSAAFADVDGDGFLDLYSAAYVRFRPGSVLDLCPIHGANGKTISGSCPPTSYPPLTGILYRSNGGRGFMNVTRAWGADTHTGNGLGAAFADYSGSGWPGLAVANDMVASDLFENRAGTGLRNIGAAAGIAQNADGKVYAGMGLDWGDFDGDGRLDLLMTAFENQTKPLYRNEGDGLFRDVSAPAGIAGPMLPEMPFGCKFADFDNDGNLDIVYANGHVQDRIAEVNPSQTYRQRARLFRGDGRGRFAAVPLAALQKPIVGRGLATGDFDNDGRIDLLIVDSEGEPLLLRNRGADGHHWLGVKLIGTRSNRDGYGAMVTLTLPGRGGATERRLVRHGHADGSYLSSSDPRLHFGLGAAAHVPSLTVRWPGGRTEIFTVPGVDRYVTLKEGTGQAL